MKVAYKKILKLSGSFLLGVVVLFILSFLVLMLYLKSDSGQAWLTQKSNKFLSKTLGTRLNIDSVTVDFPRELNLNHPVVYDHKQDTVLVAKQIGVKFNLYSFNLRSLIFGNIHLQNPRFYGRKYPGDTAFNYDYIIQNAKAEDPNKKGGVYRTLFNGVQVHNGRFVHQNLHEAKEAGKVIDFNYLDVQNLQIRADYLQFIEGSLSSEINQMSFEEVSGFKVNQLQTDLIFDKSTLSFQDLQLKTPYSRISEQITMEYDKKKDLQDFDDKVELITRFENTTLSLQDLSYFVPGIRRVDKNIDFSGQIFGKVRDFDSKGFQLSFGEDTYFTGDLSIRGLPEIDQTFLDVEFTKSEFKTADLKQLFPSIELPINLKQLGLVHFEGKFTGFPSDFVAYGEFDTDLGSFNTDINLKNPGNEAEAQYSGDLELNNFDIGELLDEELLGNTSLNGNIKGNGLILEELRANLDASVSNFHFNGYDYSNINVKGELTKELFKGKLAMDDPNIKLDFNGEVNMDRPKPQFDFKADLAQANFDTLNMVEDSLVVNAKVNLNFKANNLDDIEGKAEVTNTTMGLSNRILAFDSLALKSVIDTTNNGLKQLSLSSDIADLLLEGHYNLTSLPNVGKIALNRIINRELVPGDTIMSVEEDLSYRLHVKNAAFLMDLMKTDFILEDNTKLSGSINTKTKDFTLSGTIPGIYYKDWHLDNVNIKGSGSKESIFIQADLDKLTKGDSVWLAESNVNLLRKVDDSLQFNLALSRRDQEAGLKGKMIADKEKITGRVYDSEISFDDSIWSISSTNLKYYYNSRFHIPYLKFENGDQRLIVTGKGGKRSDEPVRVLFDKVQLGAITHDIFPQFKAYTGDLNGQVLVHNILDTPHFNSALMITPLRVDGEKMGQLNLNTNYTKGNNNINVEANLVRDGYPELMTMKGYVNLYNDKDNLNLMLDFRESHLALVEGLVNDYVSNLGGTFSAGLSIKGSFEEPRIRGRVDFNRAKLTLNYLQTRYTFDHSVSFNKSRIPIRNLKLVDHRGNKAEVNGVIKHDAFNDFNLDLNLKAENFHALNTTQKDNEVYYGQAYASGYVNFTGPLDNIQIEMQVNSEKNTVINLPVSDEGTYSGHDFINFTDKPNYYRKEYNVDFGGINLDMELDITPDALVRIIFDPRAGDVLKGRGTGDIKMAITSAGEFNMYGSYTVNSGDYLFTAFDIVKKQFELKEGGTIKWNGDPYEAQMDIQAAYSLQASPAPLLPNNGDQGGTYNRKMPVEAQLHMMGSLFSPDIDLDFEILNLDNTRSGNISSLGSQVKKIKNDEQALNQQVVSLLVMNRFYSVQSGAGLGAGQAIESSSNSLVGDLISNQLTHWVSQFSEDIKYLENVQLGIDYQSRNKTSTGEISEQELEVALSTTLFNDRVEISGSMDMENSEGNVTVSYKLTKEGRIRIKAFSRNNTNPILNDNIQKHGTGLLWRKEFDSWKEFFESGQENKQEPEKQKPADEESPKSQVRPETQEDAPNDQALPEKGKGYLNRDKKGAEE